MEYAEWQRRPVPLLAQLRHVPVSFYNMKIKSPVRWLPGVDFDKERHSEEEHHFLMDSCDQRTLKVSKEETSDGEGGEQDAAGFYVHVMLQAYDFTQEQKYLKEAERSAKSLEGLAFGVPLPDQHHRVYGRRFSAALAHYRQVALQGFPAIPRLSPVACGPISSIAAMSG